MIEILKAILLGVVEGITEWLPISSTGHMILLDEFIRLNASPAFMDMFFVLVQFGAIMAVVASFFRTLLPTSKLAISLWSKLIIASIPAAVVGLLWEDAFTALFYNPTTVILMLILFGILFLLVERIVKNKAPTVTLLSQITYRMALFIGVFQMLAAIFPGTSRSGATIIGALLLGISRTVAAEFTFYLAIPAMLGASLLKLIKFGLHFSFFELILLLSGMSSAYLVSVFAIHFLMKYIQKHDFRFFGWYRIVLGITLAVYFFF